MAEQVAAGFGGLLRELRAEAGLTQEELAEAAGLSARSVSDLERGINRTARKDTARLLADALGLAGPARAEFEAAARGHVRAVGMPAMRALPRDVASFTGREAELRELVAAAAGAGGVVGIHAIGGMAGVGKTAFAVHVAHRLADTAQEPERSGSKSLSNEAVAPDEPIRPSFSQGRPTAPRPG